MKLLYFDFILKQGIIMNEVLKALKKLIEKNGYVKTAAILEHSNTSTIRRWIEKNKIPDNQILGTRLILEKEGLL